MADPTFAEKGTVVNYAEAEVDSGATTISNVSTGDYVIVMVQRDSCSDITSVSATGFGTFSLLASSDLGTGDFLNRTYIGQATSAAASRVITASFSSSAPWLRICSTRYTPGDGLVSFTPLDVSFNPTSGSGTVATTTIRGSYAADLTVPAGKRAWLIASGTNRVTSGNHTGANGFTKRWGTIPGELQFQYDNVVTAGTYGGTGTSERFGNTEFTDEYMTALIALEIKQVAGQVVKTLMGVGR